MFPLVSPHIEVTFDMDANAAARALGDMHLKNHTDDVRKAAKAYSKLGFKQFDTVNVWSFIPQSGSSAPPLACTLPGVRGHLPD